MIKKYLILLGLLLVPCFSFAGIIGSDSSSVNQVVGLDLVNNEQGDFLDYTWIQSSNSNSFSIKSLGNGNWNYNYNGIDYYNIYQVRYGNNYGGGIYFWNDGKLIFHNYFNGTFNHSPTVVVSGFAYVELDNFGNFNSFGAFNNSLDTVLNSNIQLNHQVFGVVRGNDGSIPNSKLTTSSRFLYCLGDGQKFYCSACKGGDTYTNLSCNGGSTVIDLGLTKGSTIDDINSLLLNQESPVDSSRVPIQDTVDITDGDIIDYYENNPVYNFNKDMCYIGTIDLSSNYEDRITYYQGSGYTIYEFFEQLYGSNYKLSDLDIWLNSWLVNFNTFFNGNNRYSDGTPWYVLRYNGIGNLLIDKNNLDNPFLNNKSAYYFMASTIYDSYKGYGDNPDSEDIAVYCYKKTGVSSNIEFNPPNGIRNNIGNWVNNKKSSVGFSGWSIIQGESWDGTPLDYFTGDNIVYTGFDSFFKTSFNRFAGIFQGLDPSDLALGQIPSYIVGFLLLLILFRFLSH